MKPKMKEFRDLAKVRELDTERAEIQNQGFLSPARVILVLFPHCHSFPYPLAVFSFVKGG